MRWSTMSNPYASVVRGSPAKMMTQDDLGRLMNWLIGIIYESPTINYTFSKSNHYAGERD